MFPRLLFVPKIIGYSRISFISFRFSFLFVSFPLCSFLFFFSDSFISLLCFYALQHIIVSCYFKISNQNKKIDCATNESLFELSPDAITQNVIFQRTCSRFLGSKMFSALFKCYPNLFHCFGFLRQLYKTEHKAQGLFHAYV